MDNNRYPYSRVPFEYEYGDNARRREAATSQLTGSGMSRYGTTMRSTPTTSRWNITTVPENEINTQTSEGLSKFIQKPARYESVEDPLRNTFYKIPLFRQTNQRNDHRLNRDGIKKNLLAYDGGDIYPKTVRV